MNVAAGAEADDTLVHSFRPDRGPWGLRLRRSVSLIATPFVFGFASTGGIAVALPIVLGIGSDRLQSFDRLRTWPPRP